MSAESENFGSTSLSSQLSGGAVESSEPGATELSAAIIKQSGEGIPITNIIYEYNNLLSWRNSFIK